MSEVAMEEIFDPFWFESPCVLLTQPIPVLTVLAFAHAIGALNNEENEPGEPPDVVVWFAYGGDQFGPQVYSADALRETLAAHFAAA